MKKAKAVGSPVYLHYSDSTVGASKLDVYQQIGGSDSIAGKWVRWTIGQYSGGNGTWDVNNASYGQMGTLALQTDKTNFTYTNGSGDAGSWVDYTTGNIVGKRRDTTIGYSPYSAYATYTALNNYDEAYLGVHNNNVVNGTIRIKINDVVSTTGWDLDSNGLYNEGGHGGDNVNPAWIHIYSGIHTGDVIKIEIKDDTAPLNRHTITGLKFYNATNVNPGDANWAYIKYKPIEDSGSTQFVAIDGYVPGQVHTFMFGVAHPNHEYNANLTLSVNGTAYTLGGNLVLGQVVAGNVITAHETSTGYGNTQGVDNFGTLTRDVSWQNNTQNQSWNLTFSNTYNIVTAYTSMFPPDYTSKKIFRYADLGNNFNVLLHNGTAGPAGSAGPASVNQKQIFYGGTANLKLTTETTSPVTMDFLQIDDTHQKSYFRNSALEKQWNNGESINGGTTTITLDYQTPGSVDWSGGKTLYVSRTPVIDNAIDLIPFNGSGVVVKTKAGSGIGLTFNGVIPNRTHFTSRNNDLIGAQEVNSGHIPAKGDWIGITINGAINAVSNIVDYTTTGITLTGNANAYNNSLNQNTTGINAAAGSLVKNNALINQTTNTTGAGSFDYNAYPGNAEAHGVNGNPLFTNAVNGDFSLQSISPAINKGINVGLIVDYVGNPIIGAPDIGAYEYQPPVAPIPAPVPIPSAPAPSVSSLVPSPVEIIQTIHYYTNTPLASFIVPSSHAFDSAFTFDASESFSTKGIVAYLWDFGDGTTSDAMKVDHQYQSPGRYTVTLTVTDKDGKTSTKTQTVDVNPPKPTVEDISVDGKDLIIKGKAYQKTIVHLEIHSNPITDQTTVDDNGLWTYKVANAKEVLGAGDHTVLASAAYVLADQTELKSEPSKTYDFKVSLDGDKLKLEMGKTKTWQYVSLGLGLVLLIVIGFVLLRRRR